MLFEIEISDGFFPQTFKGEFEATSKVVAINEAKEYYAGELDTSTDEIKIISVKELNNND